MAKKSQNLIIPSLPNPHKFNRGDTVQWVRDTRYIGRVLKPGKTASIRWVDGADVCISEDELIFFTELVGGEQKIYGSYFFQPGDLVKTSFKNYKRVTFTVSECLPSGMVSLFYGREVDRISLAGNWLQLIKRPPAPVENLGELSHV